VVYISIDVGYVNLIIIEGALQLRSKSLEKKKIKKKNSLLPAAICHHTCMKTKSL
jgi:hypothetical protein